MQTLTHHAPAVPALLTSVCTSSLFSPFLLFDTSHNQSDWFLFSVLSEAAILFLLPRPT